MSYSATVRDGAARDEALKRRRSALREAPGMVPVPKPGTEKVTEPQADEKPSE